jgi:hypothetical protein
LNIQYLPDLITAVVFSGKLLFVTFFNEMFKAIERNVKKIIWGGLIKIFEKENV